MITYLVNWPVRLLDSLTICMPLDGRTKSMEAHVSKIAESQTLILAKFAGKPEPNPVEDVKMMRSSEENAEELDKSHVPEYTYTLLQTSWRW